MIITVTIALHSYYVVPLLVVLGAHALEVDPNTARAWIAILRPVLGWLRAVLSSHRSEGRRFTYDLERETQTFNSKRRRIDERIRLRIRSW
jgi:hypothetical protein